MTAAQNTFYWRLWSMLKGAVPGVDRHAVHAALSLPESHTIWNNKHFDEWKRHCLAKAQPGNYRAQVDQLKMPQIRKRVFLDHLLRVLGREADYAEEILSRMNRHGKQGGRFTTLDTASEEALEAVMIALKKECRRHWRTKADLLAAIAGLLKDHEFDEVATRAEVLRALNWPQLPPLEKLYYEPLLVVLATLKRLAAAPALNVPALASKDDPDWTVA